MSDEAQQTSFADRVVHTVRSIPPGCVATYGDTLQRMRLEDEGVRFDDQDRVRMDLHARSPRPIEVD